jgi:hypothetical protein
MANLTLRQVKGSPLTIAEMDGNFEYFTGSYTNTGTITAQGFIGSFTGSISGSVTGNAISASYAISASHAQNAVTASYVVTAQTASYLNPLSQSVQLTGSLNIVNGFISNQPTNSINLTIPSGYNALLIGPIYNSGSITVGISSRLVIL